MYFSEILPFIFLKKFVQNMETKLTENVNEHIVNACYILNVSDELNKQRE